MSRDPHAHSVTASILLNVRLPPLPSLRRPPPMPPLFPYTTLFRSCCAEGPEVVEEKEKAGGGHLPERVNRIQFGLSGRCITGPLGGPQDRKSTRLNSSHVSTSYAVFCLKKKQASSEPEDEQRPARPLRHSQYPAERPPSAAAFAEAATAHASTLSLHDALPILLRRGSRSRGRKGEGRGWSFTGKSEPNTVRFVRTLHHRPPWRTS